MITVLIFALTIAAMILLAGRVPEWLCATAGALAVICLRLDTTESAWRAIATQWDVLLFFAGLALVTAAAEEAGVFEWITFRAALWGGGSSRRLLGAVLAVSAVTTILLTNDAAALVIAPLVAVMVRRLALPPLPFVLCIAFIANAASAILPISNPTNFIVANGAGMNLPRYLRAVELPALLALCVALLVLWFLFARPRTERYRTDVLNAPKAPHWAALATLAATAGGMILASAFSRPVGVVAFAGAGALLAVLNITGSSMRRALVRSHSSIVVLVASLFVIVDGLRSTGALVMPVQWLSGLSAPMIAAIMSLLANVFNNLPVSMLVIQVLHHNSMHSAATASVAAGSIVGLAIGPNLTTIGSLSTILMLIVLRSRGIVIGVKDFMLPGLAVSAATIGVAVAALLL